MLAALLIASASFAPPAALLHRTALPALPARLFLDEKQTTPVNLGTGDKQGFAWLGPRLALMGMAGVCGMNVRSHVSNLSQPASEMSSAR